jgi:predicted phosphodiesterase
MKWSLLLLSDLHYEQQSDGSVGMRDPERFNLETIGNLQRDNSLELVISAGDMTSHGHNGASLCGLFQKNNVDEFGQFIEEFVEPLESMGLKLLLCGGNHDTYVKWPYINKPVLKYIKNKYDSTYQHIDFYKSNCYKREIHGIDFISMGIYPKNLSWLKKNLPDDITKPIVIFFHFNFIQEESYSNWWKLIEKLEFHSVIKNHNIIAIMHGHIHATTKKMWEGIPVYNGSSPSGAMLIEFEDSAIVGNSKVKN